MSVQYDNMAKQDMVAEGKRLIARVQKVELTSGVQALIQGECDKFAEGVISQAIAYDNEGIDIWPIHNPTPLQKLSNPEIERLLNVTDPNKALEYIKSYENKLGTTPTRNLFSCRVEEVVNEALANPTSTKRTLFLISTDGNPDRKGPTIEETTKQAVLALHNRGLNPARYIAVSYIILTDDFHTMACYFKLENNKNWGVGQQYDVANAILPFQIKSLGGSDNKTTVNIALGGAVSEEIDQALEDVVGVDAKSLMDLMTAYAKRGFAEDC